MGLRKDSKVHQKQALSFLEELADSEPHVMLTQSTYKWSGGWFRGSVRAGGFGGQ